jgi:hypothetical protein
VSKLYYRVRLLNFTHFTETHTKEKASDIVYYRVRLLNFTHFTETHTKEKASDIVYYRVQLHNFTHFTETHTKEKACDIVNWTKLMQILKETSIDWRKRRLVSKLYMDHSVKLILDQWETRRVKFGEAVRQLRCLSGVLSNLYRVYITKEILEVFGYSNIEGQVIHNVKCSDDSLHLAKNNRR